MAFVLVSYVMSSLLLLWTTLANSQELQSRSSHGLAFENTMPFPPSAFEFFHPKVHEPSAAPPLYPAATTSKARADKAVVASTIDAPTGRPSRRGGVGAGGVAAVVIGLVFMVLLAVAASGIAVKRRRANAVVKADP